MNGKLRSKRQKNLKNSLPKSIASLQKAMDYRDNYEQKVREAAEYIEKHLKAHLGAKKPAFGIVLGSGLGELADAIKDAKTLSYAEIPNFPQTSVPGHEGKLIIGFIEGVPVMALKGRKHYYEVADEPFNNGILQVVFPVHVLAELGVKNYFITHAAGGLNQKYKVGDLMIISSHFSFLPNPLLGRQHDFKRIDNGAPCERFQPMHDAYDEKLRVLLKKAAKDYSDSVHEGILVAATGPTYETHTESLFFRESLRADAVGMSVPPEVIIACNRGMNVVAFSCITDMIAKDGANPTNHEEVMGVLESVAVKKRLAFIIKNFFRLYYETI